MTRTVVAVALMLSTAGIAHAGPLNPATVPLALTRLAPTPSWPAAALAVPVTYTANGVSTTFIIHAANLEGIEKVKAQLIAHPQRILVDCGTCDGDWTDGDSMMAGANSAFDVLCAAIEAIAIKKGFTNVWLDAMGALCASTTITVWLWDGAKAVYAAYMNQFRPDVSASAWIGAMLGYCGAGISAC